MRYSNSKLVFLIFTLIMFICCNTGNALAQEKKSYTVGQGDTFWGISKKLDITIADLKKWNNITDNTLSVGQQLTYYTDSDSTASAPSDSSVTSLINIDAAADNTYYTVKSGDALYNIAKAHNMSVTELKSLNGLKSNVINIGQKLIVKKVSVAPSVSEFSKESSPQGTFAIYTVGKKEALADILSKFNMSVYELQLLNPEIDVTKVTSAQKITVLLPPSRTHANPYLKKSGLQNLGNVTASSYKKSDKGITTSSGELHNPDRLTAAHSNIALGSIIYIENPDNGTGIYVRINDRIPESGLKLSDKAFRILKLDVSTLPVVTIYTSK